LSNIKSSITQAPLPSFLVVIKSLINFKSYEKKIIDYWRASDELCLSLSRSALSIELIARWCQKDRNNKNISIWCPDFFCNESLSFLRQLEVEIVFYPLDELGKPDWLKFPELNKKSPDIFILVHYFGDTSMSEKVIDFCKQNNSLLIEDATHAIQPVENIGDFGDMVLYSPHKHFAIPNGAFLVIREKGPSKLLTESDRLLMLLNLHSEMLSNIKSQTIDNLLWIIKRLMQVAGIRAKKKMVNFDLDTQENNYKYPVSKMSNISYKLLYFQFERLGSFVNHRKSCASNWALYLDKLFNDYDVRFKDIKTTPYLTFITFLDHETAKNFFKLMLKAQLPVSTWPDLPKEVTDKKSFHKQAIKLRHTRIYLPVHQSVKPSQIRNLAIDFKKVIEDKKNERNL
jgi:dTDP-4-amino-4,6-dideoxygalactose transaminase